MMPDHIQSQSFVYSARVSLGTVSGWVGTKMNYDNFHLLLAQPSHESGCQHIRQHLKMFQLGRAELPRIRHTCNHVFLVSSDIRLQYPQCLQLSSKHSKMNGTKAPLNGTEIERPQIAPRTLEFSTALGDMWLVIHPGCK